MLVSLGAMPMMAAVAQEAEPEVELGEVQVTGTRIVRDGFQAPTPLTVVGADELATSSSTNVADYVNTIPAFAGSRAPTATNSSMSGGSSGMNSVNLRNLGLNRTLVLLDGRRVVGASSDDVVDVNLFPQSLIKRVDVVTGGASAAYGSDAVAGVVNFVLDKDFTGLKGSVSGGATDYGDNGTWDGNLAFGTGFAGGRGHVLLSAQAGRVAGVAVNDRPWNLKGWQWMTNPAYGTGAGQSRTVPERILVDHVSVMNGIAGGIITDTALAGTAFGEGGRPYQFNYGDLVRAPDMSGGDWQSATIRGTNLANGLTSREQTENAFARVGYAIGDNAEVFAQAMWAHNQNHNWCCAREDNATITIQADNAFIPDEVRARMTDLGITKFTLGTMNADLSRQGASNDRKQQVYTVGGNGSFHFGNDWKWDAYYQRGISDALQEATGIIIKSRHVKAIDAVRNGAGQIVCRVNADADTTNDDPACVPYDVFGIGVNGSAVLDYLSGDGARDYRDERYTQDVASASLQGEPFSLWAGPVSLAFGIEHRHDKVSGTNDPISQADGWYVGNYKVFDASDSVTEEFIETVVPLAKDTLLARSLDLNAAVRFTDYSTSGNVTTWKVGATWTPIDGVTFRGTRSRDIRAPNLQELYNTGAGGFPGIINPFRENSPSEITDSSTVGNPDLLPEKADYKGIGIVLQPEFAPGLSASVDYWDLHIDQAIGTISAQQTIDQCYAGNQSVCSALTFGPDMTIELIKLQPFNLVSQIARGVDYEASYRMRASSIVSSWNGALSLRLLATNYLKNYSSNGINTPTDTAGQNTGSGPPDWRWNATLNYDADRFTVGLTARGISSGVYLNSNVVCSTDCPVSTADNRTVNTNHIAGAVYLDTSFAYRLGSLGGDSRSELFLNVRNITNKDPAIVAPGPGGFAYEAPPANATLYDTLGRTYLAGFRFKL